MSSNPISQSSLLSLKAELERSKSSKPSPSTTARAKNKKLASSLLPKPDAPSEPTPYTQLDTIRRNLERKARIYRQLQRGKYAGISDAQLQDSLIDWDRKVAESESHATFSSDEEEEQDDRNKPKHGSEEQDEELVEWQDEFGRTRVSKLSEVPREFLQQSQEDEEDAIYGPATQFPIYQRPVSLEEPKRETFDAAKDKRHLGAAYYKLAKDEKQRSLQLQQLQQLHQVTETKRELKTLASPSQRRKDKIAKRKELIHQERVKVLGHEGLERRSLQIEATRLDSLLPVSSRSIDFSV